MRYLTLRNVVPFLAIVACACSASSASSPSESPSPARDSGAPVASGDAATEASSPADAAAEACPTYPDAGATHAIIGNLAFTADSMGVGFGTQNGSTVDLAASSIVGKTLIWATVPGGEQIANVAMPTEFGTTRRSPPTSPRTSRPARSTRTAPGSSSSTSPSPAATSPWVRSPATSPRST